MNNLPPTDTFVRHIPELTISYPAYVKAYQQSGYFSNTGTRDWEVADVLIDAVAVELLRHHNFGFTSQMDVPGEAAFETVVRSVVSDTALSAHIVYLIEPTYKDGVIVPRFDVQCLTINIGRPALIKVYIPEPRVPRRLGCPAA